MKRFNKIFASIIQISQTKEKFQNGGHSFQCEYFYGF